MSATGAEFDCERLPLGALLASVAARTPVPGGGAVASITAALSAALAQMVVNYSLGKKSLAEHAHVHASALAALAAHGRRALDLAAVDAQAYARLNELGKLDDRDERKQRDMSGAVTAAIEAPSAVLDLALNLLRQMRELCGRTNRHLASDLAIAAILADAAARSAAWNVRVNLPLLNDPDRAPDFEARLRDQLMEAATLTAEIERACRR